MSPDKMCKIPEEAEGLIEKLKSYDTGLEIDEIKHAVCFTVEHHGTQKRLSGEPYYYHPVAVAELLADLKLDGITIITALLHDTVEDTDVTLENIEKEFGKEISDLVDGVTKLTQIKFKSDNQRQAENFRKFLVAISKDIRVLLIKLADRMHNMRTLHYIRKKSKRKRIAHETMELYAALAERIGIQSFKDELQDIAFKELNNEGYESIVSRLEYLRKSDTAVIDRIVVDIEKNLRNLPSTSLKAEVMGREKMPYSIWRKMKKKNISFEQLSDIIAFRVIVETKEDCYFALGIIHSAYQMVPESFDDYISTPKNNGYQSLHTVVIGPEKHRIEIQIRTRDMHEIAEKGVAAHWGYKQDRAYSIDGKQYRWIRELLNIIENASGAEEFLEHTRLEMYHDQVFCFSPKGDLIALPLGATPVDFAFAVHSEVGLRCVGVKVNGRIMPLRSQLKNGDQVEIILSKSQKPSPSWEHFVVTGKARGEIRRFIRTEQREEYVTLGRSMLFKAALNNSLIEKKDDLKDSMFKPLLEKYSKKTADDIYASIGEGLISRQEAIRELFPEKVNERLHSTLFSRARFWKSKGKKTAETQNKVPVPIMGLTPGMAIHFAGCCHPLPGEKIAGIVNSGKGITIHTADCGELENFVDSPERWIDVAWEGNQTDEVFVGRLNAVLNHRKGALGLLANTIAQAGGNINNLRILNRSTDFFEIILDIEVRDIEHLTSVMALLRSRPNIHNVERYKEGQ